MKRVAVLDLGTNTFHLLIVEITGGQFSKMYQERIYTKLGEEGMATIDERPYERGIKTLSHFGEIISSHNVDHIMALGTAALRQASNGKAFIQEVAETCQLNIEVIDGQMEADYIYKGVQLAIPSQSSPYIIMDIGGGSVEFIIADTSKVQYMESFNIGLSPLHGIADISDVAELDDVVHLHKWLAGNLTSLYRAIEQYQPKILVGSAGAFEVLATMTGGDLSGKDTSFRILKDVFAELYVRVLGSSKEEKLLMDGLPTERVDYISAAFVLIWHIIDSIQPDHILVSKYALKEGAIQSFLD